MPRMLEWLFAVPEAKHSKELLQLPMGLGVLQRNILN